MKNIHKINNNIYITNDEEIKMGDWYIIEFNGVKITKCTFKQELISIEGRNNCQKIILTTDQSLDDVQAIDDEFLDWFVKNPSCKRVEVSEDYFKPSNMVYGINMEPYKIIIPSIGINSLNKQNK